MRLKNIFNVLMYSFILIVPLMPLKVKVLFLPMSADFIIGGMAILVGIIYVFILYSKDKNVLLILKDKNIAALSAAIAVFILLSASSVLYAQNKSAVFSETLRFFEYAALFYLILIISNKKFINNGFVLIFIAIIFASLYGVIQYALNLSNFIEGGYGGRGRIFATFTNPNYWGAAVNLVIFFPIIDLIEGKEIKKQYDIFLFLLLLFNLVFCFTRGSWLGFGLGLLVLFIIRYRKALLSIPLFIFLALITPFTRDRLLSIFNLESLTSGERLKLWKTGWLMFKDHFWFGVGNGNYLFKYYEYVKKYPELYLGRKQFSVHNSYLKMFAELGVSGGIAFIATYLLLFYLVYKVYKSSKGYKLYALAFLCFVITYLFQNFFNNLMFIPQLNVFAWIITAMLYKGYLLERREELK